MPGAAIQKGAHSACRTTRDKPHEPPHSPPPRLAGGPGADAFAPIRKACQELESKAVWARQGADLPNVSGERFAKLIHTEIGKWAQVVKLSGAKLE